MAPPPTLEKYTVTFPLQDLFGNPPTGPLQGYMQPGRDTVWDVVRCWAYSTGYEDQGAQGLAPSISTDPYNAKQGVAMGQSNGWSKWYYPVAMLYKNSVAIDNLLQPFHFVPKTYEPVALQQATRIAANERVVALAAEWVTNNYAVGGRSVTVGIEVQEYRL